MRANNPFTLTFGKKPNEFVSRNVETDEVVHTFTATNPINQVYLIEGIRGSGKTVLMTAIAKELKTVDGWIVVNLNATQDLLTDLALRLGDEIRLPARALARGGSISVAGFGIGLNEKERTPDPVSTIKEYLSYVQKKNKRILITIDEVTHSESIRRFVSQFQIFLREDAPLFLLMTGLYENIYAIQNDPALTFLLRSPKIRIGPLSQMQMAYRYGRVLGVDADTAKQLATATEGYAFAFQALGSIYWNCPDTKNMEQMLEELDVLLYDYAYQKIWEGLSQQDRAFVLCVGRLGNAKMKDVEDQLGMTHSSGSKYRDRLVKRGILIPVEYGYVRLALPRFYHVITMSQHLEE